MSTGKGQKKAVPTAGKILYGAGGLAFSTEIAFLLLFPFLFSHVNTVLLLACVPAGIILSVLVMPLCYAFVNGNTAIGTGRYHLALALSSAVCSISFVLMYGIGDWHYVAHAFAVVGLVFLHSAAAQIFAYTFFAVGIRFDRSGTAVTLKTAFALGSSLLIAAAVFLLFDGSRERVGAIAACSAIVSMLSLASVYFSTVRSMPAFIRLEPKHKRSFKRNYTRFVSPLKFGAVKLFALGTFFVYAAVAFCAAALPMFLLSAYWRGYSFWLGVVISAALAVAACVALSKLKNFGAGKCSVWFISISALLFALSAGLSAILILGALPAAAAPMLYAHSVVCGLSIGLGIKSCAMSDSAAREVSGCTPGKYYTLVNCIKSLGLGAGVAFCCAVMLIASRVPAAVAAAIVCCVTAAFFTAAAVLVKVGCGASAANNEEDEQCLR